MAPRLPSSDFAAAEGVAALSSFALEDGSLIVSGHPFLIDVPKNITATPASVVLAGKKNDVDVGTGCFLGFNAGEEKPWHAPPLGRLLGIRFMSIFRFKVWWSTLWVGTRGGDLEHETQMMVLDCSDSGRPYVLLLPLVEGSFRASLQPGDGDYIDVCVESGSSSVTSSSFKAVVYLHAGDNPFTLVEEAMKTVRSHLGTFKLLREKSPPGIVDKFGWCTWDAFYLNVHPEGVREGVKKLVAGGCPPGLVIIDDGWQSICHDDDPVTDQEGMNRTSAGEQMPCRLIKFQENHKFRGYKSPRTGAAGMGAFVRDLKSDYAAVEYVYVWHALCGYWGGVRPDVPGMPPARLVRPKLTPGLETTMEDLAVDKIVNNGIGLVPPEHAGEMYEGIHLHLKSSGIDGVKVDVIQVLEMLCEEHGGRVELAKAYYKALTESVKKHLNGNGVIASMEHCNDFMLLGTESIALGRVGDDFWCTDPAGDPSGTFWLQGCHMVHCAYNSLWMGNFIHPDWDMFQSTHPCAAFHAASRAISGGPVYVSDAVGSHDFELLRRLALPDGTILRCERYALPTRDCLFADPLQDGQTTLKVWNINKFSGVLGLFNCQGGGWSREERRNKCSAQHSRRLTSSARPSDVEWIDGKAVGLFAAYLFQAKKLLLLGPNEDVDVSLDPFHFELITFSPVRDLCSDKRSIQFAPIGLTNMLNSGGAIRSLEFFCGGDRIFAKVGVKGSGEMKVYSSAPPVACTINGEDAEFAYEEKLIGVHVPWRGSQLAYIEYQYSN